MSQNRSIYTDVKCEVCGAAWMPGVNERTGEMEPGHPDDLPCSIHRPTNIAPRWVGEALARHELATTASNLPPSVDDAEVARRELAGGTPTREWAANGIWVKARALLRELDGNPEEAP
jgi:hypothetical protein